jgi:predicted RNase H-like nuclease (RuvC/YqgF family)
METNLSVSSDILMKIVDEGYTPQHRDFTISVNGEAWAEIGDRVAKLEKENAELEITGNKANKACTHYAEIHENQRKTICRLFNENRELKVKLAAADTAGHAMQDQRDSANATVAKQIKALQEKDATTTDLYKRLSEMTQSMVAYKEAAMAMDKDGAELEKELERLRKIEADVKLLSKEWGWWASVPMNTECISAATRLNQISR